jgi:hypothetical protein
MASANSFPGPVEVRPAASLVAAARTRAGARWFSWIAGLSLINSVVVIFGGNVHFVIGLGITAVVDVLAKNVGTAGPILDVVINGFVAGMFFLFGVYAAKGKKWAFLVGMVLYALDGLLLLAAKDILSVAFHGYVLFALFRGFEALGQMVRQAPALSNQPIEPR